MKRPTLSQLQTQIKELEELLLLLKQKTELQDELIQQHARIIILLCEDKELIVPWHVGNS